MWEPVNDMDSLVDGFPRVFQLDGRGIVGIRKAAACPALGVFVEVVCHNDNLGIYRLPTLDAVMRGQPLEWLGVLRVSDSIDVCVSGTHALVSKANGPGVVVFDLETRTEVSRFGDFVDTSAVQAVRSTAIVVGCTLTDQLRNAGAGTRDSSRVWIFQGTSTLTLWSCVRVLEFPLGWKHISVCDQGTLLGIVHEGCVKMCTADGVWYQQMEFVSLCDDTYPDVDRKQGPLCVPTIWDTSRTVQHGHGWIGASRKPGMYCHTLCYWDNSGHLQDLTPVTNFELIHYVVPVQGVGCFIRNRAGLFVVVPDALHRMHTMSSMRLAWMAAVVARRFS